MKGTTDARCEFPGITQARGWYHSPSYRAILPLRTDNIEGEAILVEGVGSGYDAGRTAAMLRADASAATG